MVSHDCQEPEYVNSHPQIQVLNQWDGFAS